MPSPTSLTVNIAESVWNIPLPPPIGQAKYSPYNISIVQPAAGLDTKNRYYKAYPGIEYSVKVGVLGGDFSALTYTLTTAPEGMVINNSTGVVSWANPTEFGSPHSVTVTVTDGLSSDTVSWTITVTTAGFKFVDANAPDGGDGTILNPYNKWLDFYGINEVDSTHQDDFIYFRAGTYIVNGSLTALGGNQYGSQKAKVLMAYPGEIVTQDWSNCYLFCETRTDNFYYEGFININVGLSAPTGEEIKGLRLLSESNNMCILRNEWYGIPNSTGSFNQSYIMLASSSVGSGLVLFNNLFDCNSITEGDAFLQYWHENFVIESNKILGCGNIGIGLKSTYRNCAVRGNWVEGVGIKGGIWLYWAEAGWTINNDPNGLRCGDVEVSWNYCNMSQLSTYINERYITNIARPLHNFRNTYISSQQYRNLTLTQLVDFYDTDNVTVSSDPDGIIFENTTAPEKLVINGQLLSTTTSNFIDVVTGKLIGAYVLQNSNKGHNGMAGLK